jgi:hypothetical protein
MPKTNDFELTDFHKEIYNTYLKQLAIKLKRPYCKRKDFSKLPIETIEALLKLDLFFKRNPELDIDLYFKAGMEMSPATVSVTDYLNNTRILRYYKNIVKSRYNENVDSDGSFNDFIQGFKFITDFAKSNNLPLNEYITCVNDNGIPWCLIHLKQQKISMYHLHAFNFSISNFAEEMLNLYLEDFKQKFYETRRQYFTSVRLKPVGDKIMSKIKQTKQQ